MLNRERRMLWEQEDPEIEALESQSEPQEVKNKRNAVKRLAKQKGYKLSLTEVSSRIIFIIAKYKTHLQEQVNKKIPPGNRRGLKV